MTRLIFDTPQHVPFNVVGTETGRVIGHGPPNMREVRRVYSPRPLELVEMDFAALELRVFDAIDNLELEIFEDRVALLDDPLLAGPEDNPADDVEPDEDDGSLLDDEDDDDDDFDEDDDDFDDDDLDEDDDDFDDEDDDFDDDEDEDDEDDDL